MLSISHLPRHRPWYDLLGLKPGEGHAVSLFGAYSLLMGATVAVFYTCSTSLFLNNFAPDQLPLAFVAGGTFTYVLGLSVQWAQRRLGFRQVNAGLLLFALLSVGGLLLLGSFVQTKWLYFLLFLWNRGFVFVHGVVFWATMGRVFNLQQSKRLFSLIGLGDVVSSVISYLSVPLLLKLFSPDQLLTVSFAFLLLSAGLMGYIRRRYRAELSVARTPAVAVRQSAPEAAAGPPRKSAGRAYYSLLFLLSLLPVFGLIYVDFMFTVLSKQVYPHKESLASFLGLFFGICAIIELFVKGFLYNKLISTYSIRIGIVLLPLLLLFSFGLSALYGTVYGVTPLFFAFVALSRFFMSAIRRSVSDPAFQVLFQPIPLAERTLLQSRIEGGPKALGTALTGVVLLGLHAIGFSSMVELSYVFLAVLTFWAVSSFRIQGGYRSMLGEAIGRSAALLHRQTVRPDATSAPLTPPPPPGVPVDAASPPLAQLDLLALSPAVEDRIQAATALGKSGRFHAYRSLLPLLSDPAPAVREAAIRAAGTLRKPELWPPLFELLRTGRHQPAVRAALLTIGEPVVPALLRLFNQPELALERQADLVDLVSAIGGEPARRFLRANLNHPQQRVRDQVLLGLVRHHHRATTTERPYLTQQLKQEVELLVWLAATRLDWQQAYPPQSPLMRALTQEKERLVPKIFTLLSLLYGNNQFDVISELITQKNAETQGFLLELLSTILPTEVKNDLLPLFAEVPLAEKVRKSAANYPQQRLSVEARLHDFINRDYAHLASWPKAVAIRELLTWHQHDPTAILVANAVSADEVIAETALYVLHRLNPARFAELHQSLRGSSAASGRQLADHIAAGLPEADLLVARLAPASAPLAALVVT